jgi:hydrogenase nickel incorporation protein HypA/HybF
MHELSVAMGIVRIAEEETARARAKQVELIELEIGDLAGIELDSLEYVWGAAVKGTVLENAKRKVHRVVGKGKCVDCGHEYPMVNHYDPCPECQSFLKTIISGKELRVKALEVS